jgi:hypothetical protein
MRWLLAALIFLGTTFVTYLAVGLVWVLFIGGTECDRAECSSPGEWADENPWMAGIVFIALSALPGFLLARKLIRQRP